MRFRCRTSGGVKAGVEGLSTRLLTTQSKRSAAVDLIRSGPAYHPQMPTDRSGREPADAELIQLVRQGKVDAEIAVRLGIPIEQARERVEHLMRRHHATTRDQLRDLLKKPNREPRHTLRWNRSVAVLVFGALAVGLFGGWWLRGQSGEPDAATSETDAGPTSAPSPTAEPTPEPIASVLLDGQPMTPLGRVFDVAPSASHTDGDTLVLEFDAPVVILAPQRPATWRIAESRPDGALFSLDNGKRQLVIIARGAEGTGFAYGRNDSFSVFSRTAPGPTLRLTARSVLGQTFYTLKLDGGWLYVSEEPVP